MPHTEATPLTQLLDYVEQADIPTSQSTVSNVDLARLKVLIQQGRDAYDSGQIDSAIDSFNAIADLNPGSALAHQFLSSLYWQQGNLHQSVQQQILQQSALYLVADECQAELNDIWPIIAPYSLLDGLRLLSLYSLAKQVCLDDIPGNFVECGSYKGGAAALLAYVIKNYSLRPRKLYAFDTFAGMPEPTTVDRLEGIAANDTPWGGGTLEAPLTENLEVVCQALNVRDLVIPIPGLFSNTLPVHKADIGNIAFLHADADWYQSTREIFEHLYDSIVPDGIIQVDDYLTWEGCRKAVDEFERKQLTCFGIRAVDDHAVWFRKEETRYQEWNHWRVLWYAAQSAKTTGEFEQAERLVQAVLKIVPKFLKAEEMREQLQIAAALNTEIGQAPLVSVVIPCYNQAHFLPEAVESIVAQTYRNWEIVIVNDGSPDNTSEVAHQLVEQYPNHAIKLIEKPNGGLASARNAGFAAASGDYVLPLDSDDRLSPTALSNLVAISLQQGEPCVAFGSFKMFGVMQGIVVSADLYSLEQLKTMNVIQPASLIHKEVWRRTNGFKVGMIEQGYEDWEFWLHCHALDVPFVGTRDVVLHYRRAATSMISKANRKHHELMAEMVLYHPQLFGAEAVEQAKATNYIAALLKEIGIPEISAVKQLVEQYQENPENLEVVSQLRQVRKQIAQQWLTLPEEKIELMAAGVLGQLHRFLYKSWLKYETIIADEQDIVTKIPSCIKGFGQSATIRYFLVSTLYHRSHNIQWQHDLTRLPEWLIELYIEFMLKAPLKFLEVGEAEQYYHHMQQWVDYLHGQIFSHPDSAFWQQVARQFTDSAHLLSVYFNEFNLQSIYEKRADILEFALQVEGCEIDYEFTSRNPKQKIKLGILATGYPPTAETFALLPLYEHLSREFEVVLYALERTQYDIEQYCRSCANEFKQLPQNLQEQVDAIRADDLDILFIGTNVTVLTNEICRLALHRLARIQMTGVASIVSSGIRNIDYYLSGDLTDPATDAPGHYREKLLKLPGTAQCFSYGTEPTEPDIQVTRQDFGIADETIVFVSAANMFKIVPELSHTWAKILAAVPNSVLLLFPFGSNWSNAYPKSLFSNNLSRVFAGYGVSCDRLIIADPQPAPERHNLKAYLALGDIYLDSYPVASTTSLIEPLEVGLPTVTRQGSCFRSAMGGAMLRALGINDLVPDSEATYIQLAVALANDVNLRQQMRNRIQQNMQANPVFLNSRRYAAQLEPILQNLIHQYQKTSLTQSLRLRNINLLACPDWHQPEDILFEDLATLLRAAIVYPNRDETTLLIHTGRFDEAEADMAISSVLMYLLTEESLEVDEMGPEIVLVGQLEPTQGQELCPSISARLKLEHENQEAIARLSAEPLTTIPVSELSDYMVSADSEVDIEFPQQATGIQEQKVAPTAPPLKLHIGGKQAHPDWKILDIEDRPEVDFIGDAANLEQFADGSVAAIYASHVLEHFYYGLNGELLNTLREWHRVLQPNGKLYISVPNLKTLCQLYVTPNLEPKERLFLMRVMFGGQSNQYDVHKVGFDLDILSMYLADAGFRELQTVSEFGLFDDCSSMRLMDTLISLNVVVTK